MSFSKLNRHRMPLCYLLLLSQPDLPQAFSPPDDCALSCLLNMASEQGKPTIFKEMSSLHWWASPSIMSSGVIVKDSPALLHSWRFWVRALSTCRVTPQPYWKCCPGVGEGPTWGHLLLALEFAHGDWLSSGRLPVVGESQDIVQSGFTTSSCFFKKQIFLFIYVFMFQCTLSFRIHRLKPTYILVTTSSLSGGQQ